VRRWQAVVAVIGIAMAVAGFAYWLRGARAPGLAGTWTGTAGALPVELETGSSLRWGQCRGRLGATRSPLVFDIGQVRGAGCFAGTLRLFPATDLDHVVIKVTREGDTDITFSGTLSRRS
jgi:hypothetical protein